MDSYEPSPNTKKIIFVGTQRAGKSSLTNMLIQGDLYAQNIREVSYNIDSVTPEVKVVNGRNWTVCDTVGLSEMEAQGDQSAEPAMKLLVHMLEEGQRGFHYIAYVIRAERLQYEEHHCFFELLKSTFQGAEDNFILVVTHCPDSRWVTNNREFLAHIFGNIPIVNCDFPFDADDLSYQRKWRLIGLPRFEAQLAALPRSLIVPKLSIKETATVAVQQKFTNSLEEFLQHHSRSYWMVNESNPEEILMVKKSVQELVLKVLIPFLTARSSRYR
ncbi:hypothetical protein BGZ81_002364 [Podila clonocystis]|nr:hypothetical protein BGZ81_002364 [Podila clonocystis]